MALGLRIVSPRHRHVAVVGVLLTSFIETPCGTYALDATEVSHEFWVPGCSDVGVQVPVAHQDCSGWSGPGRLSGRCAGAYRALVKCLLPALSVPGCQQGDALRCLALGHKRSIAAAGPWPNTLRSGGRSPSVISTTSPGTRYRPLTNPTPAGEPVEMTSPGRSSMLALMASINVGTSKMRSPRVACCRSSPFTDVVTLRSAWW